MIDLSAFNGSVWLAEPTHFQQVVTRVLSAGRCFTRDEVAAARLADNAKADGIAINAVQSTGGHHEMKRTPDGTFVDHHGNVWTFEWNGDPANAAAESPKAIRAVKGKVGILPIWGPVQQRMSSELMKAGGTSMDFVSRAFDKLMNDPQIGAIVLHVDSPGGQSFGVEETATKIYNARGTKPIYSIADSVAASAAYWLATSADTLICTPGGIVGSVGVYVMHIDQSKALEMEGVKVTMVSAGKYKTELSPFGPLSAEAIDNQQKYVDVLHDKFVNALKRNRNTTVDHVRTNYGQGRTMMAGDALANGMCDRIMSMEELMSRLTGGASNSIAMPSAMAQMDAIKLRHRQRARMAV